MCPQEQCSRKADSAVANMPTSMIRLAAFPGFRALENGRKKACRNGEFEGEGMGT